MTFGQEEDRDGAVDEQEMEGCQGVGPVTVNMKQRKPTAPKIKPLFETDNFSVEDDEDQGFNATIKSGDLSQSATGADFSIEPKKKATPETHTPSAPASTKSVSTIPATTTTTSDKADEPSPNHDDHDTSSANPWLDVQETKDGRSYRKGKGETKDRVAETHKKQHTLDDVKLNLDYKKLEKSVPNFLVQKGGRGAPQPKRESDPGRPHCRWSFRIPTVMMILERWDAEERRNVKELSKMEVMQMAFANDDVFAEFREEKEAVVDADKPKDVDVTLPGWVSSWAGNGVAAKKNVVIKKAKPNEGVDASKRKDAKLRNVIINEKRNKKVTKFMTTQLPHGFETRNQYEESIRLPLGREWNAHQAHSKLVAPKVVTKMGKVIAPLAVVMQAPGRSDK
ncbi:Utp14 protein-domain-containing protein, partial [Chytridium lagenaria]